MKKFFVVNCSICFGFGGFARRAFLSDVDALEFATAAEKNGRYTDIDIYETDARTAKEATKNGPSLFAGSFAGIDARAV